MPLTKRQLQVFMGEAPEEPSVPRPTPSEVLYAPPNKDGTRKMCGNCILWITSKEQCLVHAPEFLADAVGVCGYHVGGQPRVDLFPASTFGNLSPEDTGYIETRDGTSCDRCTYYTQTGPKQGVCAAVQDPAADLDAAVASLGCCARWILKE